MLTPKLFINVFFKLALLLIIIVLFVPFSPKMPAAGLDASWAFGLNEAVAQGLSFGKEILFTLGPYSSIYTKAYHPATDLLMMGGSLYIALSYWVCLVLLINRIPWYWAWAFGILLFGMVYARDSFLFSYPLLVGLACFKLVSTKNWTFVTSNYPRLLIAVLFAPFGLLPLIKGTLLILCFIVALLCAAFFIVYKKKILALICLITPLMSMLFCWIASGQSVINLPPYIMSSFSLAAGFSEAMSIDGNPREVILYLVATALILLSIAMQKQLSLISKMVLLCIFFVFLFISFKSGFTRAFGHAFIPGTSILIAGLLLPFLFDSKKVFPVVLFSIYTWSYVDGHHTKISIHNDYVSNYASAWYGVKNRTYNKNWLKQNFDVITTYLRAQASFPPLQGTTDIYSYGQAYLISSQLAWSPRPVFQSYSVFTSDVALKNKKHLLSDQGPDNIIFKVEPIDGRVPALEDGASWPVLLENYQPTQFANNFLFLRKKNTMNKAKPIELISTENYRFGDVVTVPERLNPIFVGLEIKPTIWGRLAIMLYKPSQLHITFELKNGQKKQYRMIASMAKSGFLLSPLIEDTAEFAQLYDEQHNLDAKMVKSFIIASDQSKTWLWNPEYVIHFNANN